jgi:signal transduction histidine kinase
MSTLVPMPFEPAEWLPLFLRDWSLDHPQLATCATHDHLALIYDNQEEQLDVVVPFLRLGLERGEKAIYIHDDNTAETVVAAMERHGIDVAAAKDSGALVIITKREAYLKNGEFDPEWMIEFLAETIENAKSEGFRAVRASGEMTWALGQAENPNSRLIEYECKVNTFFPGHDMVGLCQYNRRRFRPGTLMHVIHTHPRLIFRGEVCENPYYIAPEILSGQKTGTDDPVRRLLESMAENTRLRRQLSAETEARHRSEKQAAAGQMASRISHEINNPLEAITNLWYLLSHGNLPPDARTYVECMGYELKRLSHIAKETFEFYRPGTSSGLVNVGQVLDEAVRDLTQKAQWQGAIIDVERRVPAVVYGFAGELRQVFANLIVNALEAGARKVRIRVSPGRDGGERSRSGLRVVVADDGHGIEPDDAGKIFEPFFTTKEEKGAGLGLWVGKGIVQKHEGSISMRTSTRPGSCGTTFSIFLPTPGLSA